MVKNNDLFKASYIKNMYEALFFIKGGENMRTLASNSRTYGISDEKVNLKNLIDDLKGDEKSSKTIKITLFFDVESDFEHVLNMIKSRLHSQEKPIVYNRDENDNSNLYIEVFEKSNMKLYVEDVNLLCNGNYLAMFELTIRSNADLDEFPSDIEFDNYYLIRFYINEEYLKDGGDEE